MRSITDVIRHFKQNWTRELCLEAIEWVCREQGIPSFSLGRECCYLDLSSFSRSMNLDSKIRSRFSDT
jgi:hypothetical protein